FRAFTDKELETKDPAGYERIVLPPGSYSQVVFAERTPSVIFSGKEILRIVGERTKISEVLDRIADELRKQGINQPPAQKAPENYSLTVIFNEAAAKRFRDFTRLHDREMFELRLDGERLHVGRLIGPFTGNFLSTSGFKKQDLLDLDRKFPGLIILHIE
ncbi:MAG TPA: hypothetical protein VN203_04735, partial [Candidatus Acidoferrum sp.]|nr:hypothetical protein [Candidatus Acidoferrum sp.]